MTAPTPLGALRRLVDAIEAYDDLEEESGDELSAAEAFARAILAQHEAPAPVQEGLDLGGAS